MSGQPYPKSSQLARGPKRYRRKVASPKQWQAIQAAKGEQCRIANHLGACGLPIEYHHLVTRQDGGDDIADNIVPLCGVHHAFVTARAEVMCRELLSALTDDEYAYLIQRGGEDYPERAYGVRYTRG